MVCTRARYTALCIEEQIIGMPTGLLIHTPSLTSALPAYRMYRFPLEPLSLL